MNQFYGTRSSIVGDSVPRDALSPTPPGPEGSNGNELLRVQWVAGVWLFYLAEIRSATGGAVELVAVRIQPQ
jgi:hypothetical protein